jgi:hypothetical protein
MIPITAKYFHNSLSNLLPSVLFLILISQVQWIFNSGVVSISMFFCMLTLRYVFETYHQNRVFHYGFMAGFLTSLATLLYVPSVLFLIVCWTGLILLRSFKLREILIVIIGFIIPLVFTHALFMIFGDEQKLYHLIENILVQTSFKLDDIRQVTGSIIIGILFIWGFIKSISSGSLKKIVTRRYFEILTLGFSLYCIALLLPYRDLGLISSLILLLSFILSLAITSIRKTLYASLFILFLILLQLVVQISFII